MPNDTVQAAATGLPKTDHALPAAIVITAPESCRAYQLGAEINQLAEDIRTAHLPLAEGEGVTAAEIRLDRVALMEELIGVLAEAMTYSVATSLPGALAQIIVCFDRVGDVIRSADLTADETIRVLKGAHRCLWSIAGVLAAHGGVPASQLGSKRLMPAHLNDMQLRTAPAKPAAAPAGSFVEDELVKLNASTDQWWALYDDVGFIPDVEPEANIARDEACERASLRAVKATRESLRAALALPAVSVRELGLQARLVSAELHEWWDTNVDLPEGETACRILLDRLMGLAGVTRSPRYEPSLQEAREWFAEYLEAHHKAQAAADDLPPDTSRH